LAEFVSVCRLDEVPVGEVRQFRVGGKEIALARVAEGECYAVGGRCTHLRAPLGKGALEGTTLTCPWHGSQFDVASGRLVRWVQEPAWMRAAAGLVPAFMRRNLPSYEARVENGQVLVKV
jgi:nitrite reductase/ring-hydroxylating ferredoxin subunit